MKTLDTVKFDGWLAICLVIHNLYVLHLSWNEIF